VHEAELHEPLHLIIHCSLIAHPHKLITSPSFELHKLHTSLRPGVTLYRSDTSTLDIMIRFNELHIILVIKFSYGKLTLIEDSWLVTRECSVLTLN